MSLSSSGEGSAAERSSILRWTPPNSEAGNTGKQGHANSYPDNWDGHNSEGNYASATARRKASRRKNSHHCQYCQQFPGTCCQSVRDYH